MGLYLVEVSTVLLHQSNKLLQCLVLALFLSIFEQFVVIGLDIVSEGCIQATLPSNGTVERRLSFFNAGLKRQLLCRQVQLSRLVVEDVRVGQLAESCDIMTLAPLGILVLREKLCDIVLEQVYV